MLFKHGAHIFLLSSLALVLCACGSSGSGSGGGGGSKPGPSNGKITINLQWPTGTQPTDAPKSCVSLNVDPNKYDFQFNTGSGTILPLDGSSAYNFQQSRVITGISPGKVGEVPAPVASYPFEGLPTGVEIDIGVTGDVICGDQTGYWEFDWNNQSLQPAEEKTVNATFVPDPGQGQALRLYDGTGLSSQNDRLGHGKAG